MPSAQSPVSPAMPVSRSAKLAGAALLPLLLASLWLGTRNLSSVRASNRLSDQVHEEQLAADTLLATLSEAETGQRGFLLTGDSAYLAPYTSALARVSADIDRLDRASAQDMSVGTTIDQIKALVIAKMTELTRTVSLGKSGHGDAALALVRSGYGRRFMDALRVETDILRAKEKARLSAIHARAESGGAWPIVLTALASLLLLGVVLAERRQRRLSTANLARRDHDAGTLLRTIIETTPGAIYAKDRQGRMLVANGAALTLIGKPWADVQGRTDDEFLDNPAQANAVAANDRRVMERDEAEVVEEFVGGQEGQPRVWLSTKTPMHGADGQVTGLVGVSVEITEQKHQQDVLVRFNHELIEARLRAERATQAKTRFLAGMSHELRTPLNGILGYAQLLSIEGGLTPTQSARVEAMQRAGLHLLDMITSVLDLSEIEVGHVTLKAAAMDVRQLALDCINLLRPGAEAKGLALGLEAAADVPEQIFADPTRLRQVLLNLLGNAIKFTDRGSVGVRLRMIRQQSQDAALLIEIADTGRGVKPDRKAELFQEFERLGAGATEAIEGAGLGLAISARFASLMGGRIAHADNAGGGSVFSLELPLAVLIPPAPAPPDHDSQADQPASVTGATARRLRVLVVDDLAMNRDITSALLRSAGHEPVCAEGGEAGANAAAEADFDVVLMDLRMPGVDGFEATRRIRALRGPRGQVPIIALTAQAFAEQVEECRQAGMIGHLAKPFTQAALLAALAGLADHRNEAEQADNESMPVIDTAIFETNAAFLTPASLVTHLQGLIATIESIVPTAVHDSLMIETAHALAGAAGMLGFVRLTDTARRFEHAALMKSPDISARASMFYAALEASLPEMRRRLSEAAQPAKSEGIGAPTRLRGERVG